ncbi:MAG: putrescine--2-oxoglutarate aminotransferase [Clostridiaceae bacterium BRH_c20a]|nr:MAG: putrescine--2-oxoglutarate aminotransferase [Clostridiaceae bacterium BRH_c20a]
MNLTTLEEAINLTEKEVKELHREYLNPGLVSLMSLIGFDKVYSSGEGSIVRDIKGKEYIDFLGGYGSLNLGHNPSEVFSALEKVKSIPNILQASLGSLAAVLAKNLALIAPGDLKRSFFCNSGAEAVEGALKLARIASKKEKIIYCEGSFHGKTLGALSVTGREKYKKHFQPLIPNCQAVPFGDINSLESAIKNKDCAAFIMECIQGEGGIIVPPEGYLKMVQDLCLKYDVLLIIDEIQTGLGRTGKIFACEYEDVVPDIMCLAKSLGGGIMPLGAYITNERIYKNAYGGMEKALLHTSTFGGNSLACAAGIAALKSIIDGNLTAEALNKGNYLISELKILKNNYGLIKDVRGKGLMIGLELSGSNNSLLNRLSGGTLESLANEYFASFLAGKLLNDYQIITAYTLNNPNVIRIEPPLTIEYKHLDRLLLALEDILKNHQSFIKMAFANIKNVF